jgi:flagellar hook-length control protein FliK
MDSNLRLPAAGTVSTTLNADFLALLANMNMPAADLATAINPMSDTATPEETPTLDVAMLPVMLPVVTPQFVIPQLPAPNSPLRELRAPPARISTDAATPALDLTSAAISILPHKPEASLPAVALPVLTEKLSQTVIIAAEATTQAAEISTSDSETSGAATLLTVPETVHKEPPVSRELRAPVGSPAFTRQLSDEITWMMQQGRDAVSIKLSPEQLGPIEVRISIRESDATVWFGAAQAETRSAIEQSLPRLREMLSAQGLMLSDAGVFKDTTPKNRGKAATDHSNDLKSAENIAITRLTVTADLSLLDIYA